MLKFFYLFSILHTAHGPAPHHHWPLPQAFIKFCTNICGRFHWLVWSTRATILGKVFQWETTAFFLKPLCLILIFEFLLFAVKNVCFSSISYKKKHTSHLMLKTMHHFIWSKLVTWPHTSRLLMCNCEKSFLIRKQSRHENINEWMNELH